VETVDPLEVALSDALEAIQAVTLELAQLKDIDEVAEGALGLALRLTRSSVAFIGLADAAGAYEHVYSRAAGAAAPPPRAEAERLMAAARSNTHHSICGHPLNAAGEVLGMIGVARISSYSTVDRQAFAIFANHVASSLQAARLRRRREEMVGALINLRADLERTEKERLLTVERAASAERVEVAHELAVEALLAVSTHAGSNRTLVDFYRHLSKSIAELVGAGRVLFWQLDEKGSIRPISGGYGTDTEFISRLEPVPCDPARDDIASRVVFKDVIFRAATGDKSPDAGRMLASLGVSSAIGVPWRSGDLRLGLVAAYDSKRPEGFTREDTWVLQKAALSAGLVWQLKLAEGDLKKSIDRLQNVDAARQLLLKAVTTAVDDERKRFASELHDDALQKLTAVELNLARLEEPVGPGQLVLSEVKKLLVQTEDALRRLLFDVRPPALEDAGGLEQSVVDRLAILRSLTGIEAKLELELSEDLTYESRSIVFRQVAEALTNIEKHAKATQITVRLTTTDGGVYGLVEDNGSGFVVAERNNLPGHLGLLALKERALMSGGWYKIDSRPGLGTQIEFWIPVSK
jgi:signal transduction histidine kinase